VHKFHKCTYIRQYHNLRPFIKVTSIPEFDPTKLPYWDIYIKEKKAKSIIVGGTIAGQFMSGLSGGQRKILLFELICQRVANQENLLIVLDEPFSGVTDDFIPYIIERLNQLRVENNILLVTNDHVDALKKLADNTITVSAIDRSTVSVNRKEGIDRELALLAMSIGDEYSRSDRRSQDIKFFVNVELSKYGGLWHSLALCIFGFSLFLATYWDSRPGSEPFVLVSSGLVGFFSLLPLGLSIVDWRVYMLEEAEALLHSSSSMNKTLKFVEAMVVLLGVATIQFWVIDAVIGTLTSPEFFFGMAFDFFSYLIPLTLLGLYTSLTMEETLVVGLVPFLLMIFFSTTFSPGAGIEGLKDLRYLFSRFYMWCMLPNGYGEFMEGCPADNNLLYLILTSLITPYLFSIYAVIREVYRTLRSVKDKKSRLEVIQSAAYANLQLELFGKKNLMNLKHQISGSDDYDLKSCEPWP